ncbi:MAG: hypothetical protein AABZ01_04195 [Gemmatimonadota bacterium]
MPSRLTWSLILGLGAPIGLSAQQAPPSTDIWLVRWGGKASDARNLTDRPGYDNQPSFSPDGRWVLYSSERNGQTEIYRYDLAQRVTMPLTATAESEYSPQVMPDGLAFSVVRVEADSTQRLWAFSMNGQTAVPLLADTKPVGYHAWADSTTVVLYVLGNPSTLQVADVRKGTAEIITGRIGRSLKKVPGVRAVSFVDQSDSTRWVIRNLDLAIRSMTEVAPTLPGREDFTWRARGSLLMASGTVLYEWNRGKARWDSRQDFAALGFTSITRLAVSPDGRWIALVADRPASP